MKKSLFSHTAARLTAVMVLQAAMAVCHAQEIYRMEAEPATVQLRTNGLYTLALCPNIGIEIQTDTGLAWQLDYIGAWWNNDARHRYYSNYIFQTEVRYYPSKNEGMPYLGHHVGLYGQMITFDFEFGGKGYMSRDLDDSFGLGVSYGYSFAISREWSIDLTAGLGFVHARYDTYLPSDSENGYARIETRQLNFIGPTKLEACLVWNINTKNVSKR